MDSFLRWAGSKRSLLPTLRRFWRPTFKRYIEPFAGSAALFFSIEPNAAVLGDLNEELCVTYRCLLHDVERVIEILKRQPVGQRHYYKLREVNPVTIADNERAARFLYLNGFCFNGIYRTNSLGQFNVPFGSKTPRALNYDRLRKCAELLPRATIVHGDFEKTLNHAQAGDFAYLDPPYAVESRRVFREYSERAFSGEDLGRLEEKLHTLDERGVAFVISYADSSEARRILKPWRPRRIWTRRNVAGFAANRRGAYEVIATNIPS